MLLVGIIGSGPRGHTWEVFGGGLLETSGRVPSSLGGLTPTC
jgi:hypothetical protein